METKYNDMTKQEAIDKMIEGEMVTHTTFSEEEWITMLGHTGKILTEEGYKISSKLFWRDRQHPNFNDNWSIWKEKIIS